MIGRRPHRIAPVIIDKSKRISGCESGDSALCKENKTIPSVRDAYDVGHHEAMGETLSANDPGAKAAADAMAASTGEE